MKQMPEGMETMLDGKHTAMMLAVVFFATFMDGLDGSIVNVTMPDIGKDFGIDTATVSWVSITYLMILAGTLVAFARIAADTGVRKVMALGLTVFTVASLFCGISSSFGMLIASRAVQAVGAGMMAAAGPMCCTEHLPVSKLAFGLSIVTIGASLGFSLGPAIGGAILEFTTWHWVFLLNIPIGLISIPLMLAAIPKKAERSKRFTLDSKGTSLLFAAIVLITFGIETLSYSSMRAVSAISMIAGVVVLLVFVKVEKKTDNPLLRVSMFRRLDFTAIFVCLMIVNMAYTGILYLTPFFGEICLGFSAFEIGMVLLFSALITAALGMPVAKWSDRRGRKVFCIAAGLLCLIAFGLLGLLADGMDTTTLVLIMIPMGLGWTCVGGPMASRLVEHAGDERHMAASLTNEAYYIGGAVGTALAAMSFTIFSDTDGTDIQDVSSSVFVDGFMPACVIMALCCLAIVILSALVKDDRI